MIFKLSVLLVVLFLGSCLAHVVDLQDNQIQVSLSTSTFDGNVPTILVGEKLQQLGISRSDSDTVQEGLQYLTNSMSEKRWHFSYSPQLVKINSNSIAVQMQNSDPNIVRLTVHQHEASASFPFLYSAHEVVTKKKKWYGRVKRNVHTEYRPRGIFAHETAKIVQKLTEALSKAEAANAISTSPRTEL